MGPDSIILDSIEKQRIEFDEIHRYRHVLFNLIKRNLGGRYGNMYLEFLRHVVIAMVTVAMYYIVFSSIRQKPIDDYAFYLCTGVFVVSYIGGCMKTNAIKSNMKYISKMYFPRILAPLADCISRMITFIITYSLAIIFGLCLGHQFDPSILLLLPVWIIILFLFGFGCSMMMSTLTTLNRDIQYAFGFIYGFLIWITPTFFLISDAGGALDQIIWYNPLTYFVEVFHSILYTCTIPSMKCVAGSLILTVAFLIVGSILFFRYKDKFTEVA